MGTERLGHDQHLAVDRSAVAVRPATTATGDTLSGATSVTVANPAGFAPGDLITVDADSATINNSYAGGNPIPFTPGLATNHYSSSTIRVIDLTRNVLIRSSGTDVTANSAYVENLVQNTTSFNVNYTAFAYLGNSAAAWPGFDAGLAFVGAGYGGDWPDPRDPAAQQPDIGTTQRQSFRR